jgi:hypothetical protein
VDRAGRGDRPDTIAFPIRAIVNGWGFGTINTSTIQPDMGGDALRQRIIGLVNKGQPRKPDDWGALRAWGWGVSKLIDYFEANPDSKVNPKAVGIEGASRYSKAAIEAAAFDPRVAAALVTPSGEGGTRPYRYDLGESVEDLTGIDYHLMAGNFMKYGASDIKGKAMNASDLPVDSHELIALCAPRLVLISHGGMPDDAKWSDAAGTYRAGIMASKVYEVLGRKGYGTDVQDWVHEALPPVGTLKGGELAFRQQNSGPISDQYLQPFYSWIANYIKSPTASK